MQFKSLTTAILLAGLLVPSNILGAPIQGSSDAILEERKIVSRLRKMALEWAKPVNHHNREAFEDISTRQPIILSSGGRTPIYRNLLASRELVDLESKEPRRGRGRGGRRARRSYVDEDTMELERSGPTSNIHVKPIKDGDDAAQDLTTRGAYGRLLRMPSFRISTCLLKTRSPAGMDQQLELAIREPATREQNEGFLKKYYNSRKPIPGAITSVKLPRLSLPRSPKIARGFDSIDED